MKIFDEIFITLNQFFREKGQSPYKIVNMLDLFGTKELPYFIVFKPYVALFTHVAHISLFIVIHSSHFTFIFLKKCKLLLVLQTKLIAFTTVKITTLNVKGRALRYPKRNTGFPRLKKALQGT